MITDEIITEKIDDLEPVPPGPHGSLSSTSSESIELPGVEIVTITKGVNGSTKKTQVILPPNDPSSSSETDSAPDETQGKQTAIKRNPLPFEPHMMDNSGRMSTQQDGRTRQQDDNQTTEGATETKTGEDVPSTPDSDDTASVNDHDPGSVGTLRLTDEVDHAAESGRFHKLVEADTEHGRPLDEQSCGCTPPSDPPVSNATAIIRPDVSPGPTMGHYLRLYLPSLRKREDESQARDPNWTEIITGIHRKKSLQITEADPQTKKFPPFFVHPEDPKREHPRIFRRMVPSLIQADNHLSGFFPVKASETYKNNLQLFYAAHAPRIFTRTIKPRPRKNVYRHTS